MSWSSFSETVSKYQVQGGGNPLKKEGAQKDIENIFKNKEGELV